MSKAQPLTSPRIAALPVSDRDYTVADQTCPGLRLRVQPSGGRSWVMSERRGKRSRRVTLGPWPDLDPEAARAAYHLRKRQVAASAATLDHARPSARTQALTFNALADLFMAAKRTSSKPSSLDARGSYLNAQLRPAFGKHPIHKISPADVANWFYAYSADKPGGANEALALITTILNWGKANGHLSNETSNPAAPIRKNRRPARGRMLSLQQIEDLAYMLDDAAPCHWLQAQALRLMLLTGCRSGEILSLHWADVKPTRLALRDAKTGPRDVYLSAPARDAFRRLKKATGHCPHVFPSAKSRSGHLTCISGTWRTMRDLAGLPEETRIHDLRHTYASHAILAGESLPVTGKLLGHKTPRSTKRYAHLDGSTLAKAADLVAKLIDKQLNAA